MSRNRRVSVVESGDLILGSFNLEIRRTKVLCMLHKVCLGPIPFHCSVSASHCGFLSLSLEDIRGKEGGFTSFHSSRVPRTGAYVRKLFLGDGFIWFSVI